MSTHDTISAIEDEPYEGVYRGAVSTYADARDHLPDRFDLADILRTTRQARGWSLEEVADMTRVRRAYLEALEQAAYDVLPPRAFAIGYVKAYAKALGLDEETLADMFKRDVTEPSARLHAPSGASLEDVRPNYRLYITVALGLVAAVIVWNVVQRKPINFTRAHNDAAISSQSWSIGVPLIRDGVVYVSKPAAAPKDQDIPAPYVTPGLEAGFASLAADGNAPDGAASVAQDDVQMRKAFNPRGAVYGAQPENSIVTIQAKKSVNLVVRDNAGTVYFVHQLGAGEAYRLPLNTQQDVLIDVSEASALEVYHNGEYAGAMDATVMPIGKLNARAAQMAAALDARQMSTQTQSVARTVAPAPVRPTLAPRSTAPIPYMPAQQPKPAAAKPVPVPAESHSASSAAPAPAVETPTAQE